MSFISRSYRSVLASHSVQLYSMRKSKVLLLIPIRSLVSVIDCLLCVHHVSSRCLFHKPLFVNCILRGSLAFRSSFPRIKILDPCQSMMTLKCSKNNIIIQYLAQPSWQTLFRPIAMSIILPSFQDYIVKSSMT